MYAWKDPETGRSKLSNIAPPWYSRDERVSGPRVIKTLNGKVADDTALAYEDRLLLSGRSREDIENLRLRKDPASRAGQDPVRESARSNAESAARHSADMAQPRGEAVKRKKS